MVTSRHLRSASSMAWSSRSRPISEVSGRGRFVLERPALSIPRVVEAIEPIITCPLTLAPRLLLDESGACAVSGGEVRVLVA